MATQPQFITQYRSSYVQYVNAGAPAQVAWQAGPLGSRIHAIRASQDDTTTAAMSLYRGRILTDNALPFPFAQRPVVGKPPILAATKTTNDHVDRTNGSFVQDGWVAGMMAAILDSTDNPQNQVIAHVTTVVAATLTYTGSPLNATAATIGGAAILALVNIIDVVAMVSGAGNSAGVPNIALFSTTSDVSLLTAPDTFITLGPYELLVINCGTLPAANKSINLTVDGGDY